MKNKRFVPNKRFPEFVNEGEWGKKELNKLAVKVTKKNKDDCVNRVFTNSAVDGVVDQRDYFDKDIANQNNLENYFVVEQGDYIYNPRISTTAPVGPISKNRLGTGVMSPLYTVFRLHNENCDFYAHYYKTSIWHTYLRSISNVGARHDRMSITATDFMKMPIPVPSPKEQQKIADCLTSLDKLISAHTDKLATLKDHKKGLMQKLFPKEGASVPELRFKGFSGDWIEKPFGKIGTNLNNKRIPITKGNRVSGDIPYYGATGIIDYVKDYIYNEDVLCISEDGANLIARTYPIAFSVTGKCWVNNHAHVLKFESKSTQIIVQAYLNAINLEDYLTGMAQPKLNRAKLDSIPIPLPLPAEQKEVAGCITSLDNLITAQSDKIETLKLHKKGLMQQLFPSAEEVNV